MNAMRYKWINYLLAIIILLPICILILWSFAARWPWPDLFIESWTLRGFNEIWGRNQNFTGLLFSSVLLSLLVASLSVIIGLLTSRAYLHLESKVAKRIVYAIISTPFLVPALVFSMGIHQSMIRSGLANSFVGVMIAHLIYSLPYASYLILEAHQTFAFKYEEQALLLGASPSQAFFKVSFPLLLPVFSSSFALAYVVSFSQYFITLLLGGGQVHTFAIVMFPYLQNNDRTIASNYALLFLLTTLIIFFIFERLAVYFQRKYQKSSYY